MSFFLYILSLLRFCKLDDDVTNVYNIGFIKDNFPKVYNSKHKTSILDYLLDQGLSEMDINNVLGDCSNLTHENLNIKDNNSVLDSEFDKQKFLFTDKWKQETERSFEANYNLTKENFKNKIAEDHLKKMSRFYYSNTYDQNLYMHLLNNNFFDDDKMRDFINANTKRIINVLSQISSLYRETDRFTVLLSIKSTEETCMDKIQHCIKDFYILFSELFAVIKDNLEKDRNVKDELHEINILFYTIKNDIHFFEQDKQLISYKVMTLVRLSNFYIVFQIIMQKKFISFIKESNKSTNPNLSGLENLFNLKLISSIIMQDKNLGKHYIQKRFEVSYCIIVTYFNFYRFLIHIYIYDSFNSSSEFYSRLLSKLMYQTLFIQEKDFYQYECEDADDAVNNLLEIGAVNNNAIRLEN